MKIFLRVLHGLAVVVTGVMAAIVMFVLFVAWALVLKPDDRHYLEWGVGAVLIVLLFLAFVGIWKRIGYRWLVPTMFVFGGCLAWLARDEPRGYEPTIQRPFGTKESEGFQVLRWMVKDAPNSRLEERNNAKLLLDGVRIPEKSAEWAAYISQHKNQIIAAWLRDSVGKDWVAALLRTEPSALVREEIQHSTLRFSTVREIFEIRSLYAIVRFIEGNSDEAYKIMNESVGALSNLGHGGGTMVNEMMAAVLLKRAYMTLNYFLDARPCGIEQRKQLLVALKNVPSGSEICRLMFDAERLYAHQAIPDKVTAEISQMLSSEALFEGVSSWTRQITGTVFIAQFLMTPRHAGRRYDQVLERICLAASERNTKELEHLVDYPKQSRLKGFELKDPFGRFIASSAIAAFEKVIGHMWEIDDQRLLLIGRLEATKP